MTSSSSLQRIALILALCALSLGAGCGRTRRGGGGVRDLGGFDDGGRLDLAGFDAGSDDAGGLDGGSPEDLGRSDLGRVDSGGTATEGDLRLSSGSTGLLEVFHAGAWGTVCNDLFDDPTSSDPNVACRQLGFPGGVYMAPSLVTGSGEIWMDDVLCTGSEARLVDCPFGGFGIHNCSHGEDVGLDCRGGGAP